MKHVIHLTQIEVEQAIRDWATCRAIDIGIEDREISNSTGRWKLEILCDCPDGTQSSAGRRGHSLHKVTAQISLDGSE
jgi:hypothetical protein